MTEAEIGATPGSRCDLRYRVRGEIFGRLACLLLLTGGGFLAGGCDMAPAPIPTSGPATVRATAEPIVNEEAIRSAFDVPIVRLDGSRLTLSEYKGKVLVVDFWATYCPPCVRQAPQLAELSRRYRDQGLVVIGLTSDEKSDQPKVEEFIRRAGVDYTIAYSGSWISRSFLFGTEDETGSPPIPQLFIISRDGRVVEHLVGDSPLHGLAHLEEVVRRELTSGS